MQRKDKKKKILYDNPNEILYVNFNQDGSCLAIGTENGFKIINVSPFIDSYYKDLKGGIGIIEMLYKSNILALVGGGKNPKYKINELILWDEEKDGEICHIKTNYPILNVKLRENKIFIVNARQILVFDFNTLNIIDNFQTNNIKGLISLCYKEDIVAFPDIHNEGTVRIKNYDTNKEYTLKAHKTPLNCIQINQDGTMIGTCSLKGTLIRVYDIANKQLIREVRRGAESAHVNCIAFDISKKFFVVVSDRKTIHIFFLTNNINENQIDNNNEDIKSNENDNLEEENYKSNSSSIIINDSSINNKKSMFGEMSKFLGVGKRYFASEWSFSKFKIISPKTVASFGPDNTIFMATYDGKYYQVSFDPINGGDCIKIQEERF